MRGKALAAWAKRGIGIFGLGALAIATVADARGQQPGGSITVYEGATLITGEEVPPLMDAVFIVQDGKFIAVGQRPLVSIPSGATRVDLRGKTVMPALIDTHKHLTTESRDALVDALAQMAYYGVGGAMNLGTGDADIELQVRGQSPPNVGRFRTSGPGITRPEPGRSEIPHWVNTVAEARSAVQELAAQQVDIIKIWVDDRNGQYEKLTPELYGAIIDEAHRRGVRVIAHIFTLEDAKGLLRAGVDAFAHGVRDRDVDDEFMELLRTRPNLVLGPNLPDRGVATDLSWLSGTIPAAQLREMQAESTDRPAVQQTFGIQARNLARMYAAGVRIVMGTDGAVTWAPLAELEDMVAAGMSPAAVIVAATRNSADFLRLSDAGTIATGKSADFVILDANPLDDIRNSRRISQVFLRGAPVDRESLSARWTQR